MNQGNGPHQLHNLSSSSNINWEKYRSKGYLHFDERIQIGHMKANLLNKDYVASYAFLPFIHFEMNFKRFVTVKEIDEQGNMVKRKERGKPKKRQIFYAAHKDSFIYEYCGAFGSYAIFNL